MVDLSTLSDSELLQLEKDLEKEEQQFNTKSTAVKYL